MRGLGWVEGRNLTFERRLAEGRPERLQDLASELVRLKVHVVIAATNFAARTMQRATRSIPIVALSSLDPVGVGLAQTLMRPGGNITGILWADPAFSARSMQLLKEAAPHLQRVGILYSSDYEGIEPYIDAEDSAARALGATLYRFPVLRPEDVVAALVGAKKERIEALRVRATGAINVAEAQIREFAAASRIPEMYSASEYVERGAFMSYAPKRSDAAGRGAALVDKILKGAKAAELPFEYPTRTELVVNLRTAKERGIKVPQSILLRADRVIE